MTDPERKYVCTGPPSSGNNLYLQSKIFVPVDILEKRLCGTKAERELAYMQDWLTFYYNPDNTYTREYGPHNLPKRFKEALPPLSKDAKELWTETYSGKHLGLRDENGNCSDEKSRNFLTHLLAPGSDETFANIPQLIFKRWACTLFLLSILGSRFWKIADVSFGT